MFKYFHLCSHVINRGGYTEDDTIVTIVNNGTLNDALIKGAAVLTIENVQIIELKPGQQFRQFGVTSVRENVPTRYYEKFLKNRIKWIGQAPQKFRASIKIRYENNVTEYAPANACLRCDGKGWYIDLIGEEGFFEVDAGKIKIVQRILKDFLTELSTNILDTSYGTLIHKEIVQYTTNDEVLFDDIRMSFIEVEQRYLQRQAEILDTLSQEEILVSASVDVIERLVDRPTKIKLQLRFVMADEDRTFQLSL